MIPDFPVDNEPWATYGGTDAQLDVSDGGVCVCVCVCVCARVCV